MAPGDRVDILLTRSINGEITTSMILQNVLVIATDQTANAESSAARVARTATVEVDPPDASKLALSQQVGKLSLSLRGMDEAVEASVEAVSIGDLPDQPHVITSEPAPLPSPPNTVTVRKGTAVERCELPR